MDKDGYYIDRSQISLAQFRRRLESSELSPGRKILQEDTALRFAQISAAGISNLAELAEALKTKKRASDFAACSGLDSDYLTILRREVNSYHPNPVRLERFPGIDDGVAARLAAVGIRDSRQLYAATSTVESRASLASEAGVDPRILDELVGLSDLVRVNGAGPIFARMLFDSGTISTAELASAQPAALFQQLITLNQEKAYTRASFTEKDMATVIELAQRLPQR